MKNLSSCVNRIETMPSVGDHDQVFMEVDIRPSKMKTKPRKNPCSLLFGYYPGVHYFYVPWLIMTSQWVMTLLGMPHCGTTMGNDVAKDVHYDVTMDNDVAMNLFCYVLLRQIMILLFQQ